MHSQKGKPKPSPSGFSPLFVHTQFFPGGWGFPPHWKFVAAHRLSKMPSFLLCSNSFKGKRCFKNVPPVSNFPQLFLKKHFCTFLLFLSANSEIFFSQRRRPLSQWSCVEIADPGGRRRRRRDFYDQVVKTREQKRRNKGKRECWRNN